MGLCNAESPTLAIAAHVAEQFGMTLDHSTIYRVLNGKREQDTVVAA